jgi:hypothetical protein
VRARSLFLCAALAAAAAAAACSSSGYEGGGRSTQLPLPSDGGILPGADSGGTDAAAPVDSGIDAGMTMSDAGGGG